MQTPIVPSPGGTVTLSVTSTSSNSLITVPTGNVKQKLKLTNGGSKTCFVRLGVNNSVAALVASDMPVLAGESQIIDAGAYTYIAAICGGADTTTLYVTTALEIF